jgi:signal transduction histidine kinase
MASPLPAAPGPGPSPIKIPRTLPGPRSPGLVRLAGGLLALGLLAVAVSSLAGAFIDRFRLASAAPTVQSDDGGGPGWAGLWARHGPEIILIAVLVVGQSVAIAGLVFERRCRRRAEREARQRLAEVAELDRVASAGTLSASIAHELNQPLGAILSNAEAAEIALYSAAPDLDMCKESLGDIRRDVRRAADILGHLRGLLKRTPVDAQEADANEAVRAVLKVIAATAREKGITLSSHLSMRPLLVRADPVHLQQAFLNAALNGFDAMDQNGDRRRHLSFQTTLSAQSEVLVSVADRGTGIPPDELKQIFDRLYTTKKNGTGLGLPIARMIVETYGGRVWAANRGSGGAVIRFSLPLAPAMGRPVNPRPVIMPQRTGAPAAMS